MNGGFVSTPTIQFTISSAAVQSKPQDITFAKSKSKSKSWTSSLKHRHLRQTDLRFNNKLSIRCNCSPGTPTPPGEDESKNILDAFFLGKALAEALNERIESSVGEFLSTIGRLQAEQQKQILDFQEDVLERAKQAKEKATRESMEARGIDNRSSSSTSSITIIEDGADLTIAPPASDNVKPASSSFSGEIVISDED
ncbi:uncharacterized protein At4g13200, chloroplastic [Impatiens glandulifera]|uniref:uncharacterized protein At4g13200, chloroplastic n=1 Tax=Impatiens glandulifera TaxID=253017 RepID=UPI001FB05876|nr:uncharacterized protein At4g13200, chloroplastic [Impatiens glandulifera]